jgi:hypothetical protein
MVVNASNSVRWRWDQADPFGSSSDDTNPQGDYICSVPPNRGQF